MVENEGFVLLDPPTACTVCFEHVWEGKITPCQHVFHKKCIEDWLRCAGRDSRCPNCNGPCTIASLEDYSFVGFLGVFNGEGQQIPLAEAAAAAAELMGNGAPNVDDAQPDDLEVQWVMDIPAAEGIDNEVASEGTDSDMEWVQDIPAGDVDGHGEVDVPGNSVVFQQPEENGGI